MADKLLPCPFCGSDKIDPEGWTSTERKGPACDDCSGSADTVELWNKRPATERLQRLFDQIMTVADDNSGPDCRHDLALKFVRQIAAAGALPSN